MADLVIPDDIKVVREERSCDYRKPGCDGVGYVIGGRWVCVNHLRSGTHAELDEKMIKDLRRALDAANKRIEELRATLQRIVDWCEAYPVDIFPEPDWADVKAKLGETLLSRVSASNMRHVCDGIAKIAMADLIIPEDIKAMLKVRVNHDLEPTDTGMWIASASAYKALR